MLTTISDYCYVFPRSFTPDGNILPARGHAEQLVRATDLAFIREAVLERSDNPIGGSFYPFTRSTIGIYNGNPHNETLESEGYAWWHGITSSIRGFFTSGKFIDPNQTLTGGQGQFSSASLAPFQPATPSMSTTANGSASTIRRIDTMRRMFYDIGRLTRCSLTFTASYGVNGNGWSASSFSWRGGPTATATDADLPTVSISGGIGADVRTSPLFSIVGATAIISFQMTSTEMPAQAAYKWLAVPMVGNTVPLTGWRGTDLQQWAYELGWTSTSDYQWDGVASIEKIYFDVVYPAEINSLNWSWQPS